MTTKKWKLLDQVHAAMPSKRFDHLAPVATLFDLAALGQAVRAIVHVPPAHGFSTLVRRGLSQRLVEDRSAAAIYVHGGRGTFPESGEFGDRIRVVSPLGALGGFRADIIVIDGLFKCLGDVTASHVQRLHDWMETSLFSRAKPNAAVIFGDRCYGADDVACRVLGGSLGGARWELVHLPALSSEGTPLWPEGHPAGALFSMWAKIGEEKWNVLYQGGPLLLAQMQALRGATPPP